MNQQPTPNEQFEIDAFQNGVYGAEPPQWWLNPQPTHRIEWCGRIKVYVPIKPRGSK